MSYLYIHHKFDIII